MADCGEHALHLMLAAFVDHELDLSTSGTAGPGGSRAPVVELDPVFEPLDRGGEGIAFDRSDVDLVDLVTGMREPVGELAVVREQERAGRVGVEAPDGDDPAGCPTSPTTVGRPAGRVPS